MWLGTFPLLQPLGLIQSLDSETKAPETADFAHVRDNLKAVQVGGAWSQVGGAWVADGRDVGLGAGGRGTAEAYYCFVVLYRGIAVIPVWVDIKRVKRLHPQFFLNLRQTMSTTLMGVVCLTKPFQITHCIFSRRNSIRASRASEYLWWQF